MKKLSLIFLTMLFFVYFQGAQQVFAEETVLRVALSRGISSFELAIRGRFQLIDQKTNTKLLEQRSLRKSRVIPVAAGIQIGKVFYSSGHLNFQGNRRTTFTINGRRYKGSISIVKDEHQKMLVIHHVELEKYIKGVLYHEMSHRWPTQALKAQAVAARTYALYRAHNNDGQLFDVTNDIYSQVYGGDDSQRYRTNRAVQKTKGEILVFQEKIIPAYFHSNSGGHTEDAGELWKHDLLPLKGVSSPFSVDTPNYHWKRNFRSGDIQNKLKRQGYDIGLIKDIKVLERNASGRIRNLLISARDGKTLTISGKDFRNTIGPNVVRSNNYKVVMKGYYFDLIGKGWGHGVGMCQWGARQMALKRYRYDEILTYFYPEVKIVNYQKLSQLPGSW